MLNWTLKCFNIIQPEVDHRDTINFCSSSQMPHCQGALVNDLMQLTPDVAVYRHPDNV